MKILVTGGAGFIGSNIVDAYIKAGHEVAIVDDLSSGKQKNINDRAVFFKLDIGDNKINDILKEFGPEIINHLAAQIDVRRSVEDPVFNAKVNDIGTLNLLQAAIKNKVSKVIFSSTGGALYGEIEEQAGADELHKQDPISPYAISKRTAEMYLYFYHATYGLKYTILRYGNVYGPRQDPHGEAGVIAILIGKLLKGEVPTIFGNGEQLRDYVYVSDIAEINTLVLDKGENQIFNIGSGIGTSVNSLYEKLKHITGAKVMAQYAPPRPGELFRSVLNGKKIARELGWAPKTDISTGLKRTLEYFRNA